MLFDAWEICWLGVSGDRSLDVRVEFLCRIGFTLAAFLFTFASDLDSDSEPYEPSSSSFGLTASTPDLFIFVHRDQMSVFS
jgi:hypothetical protein